MIREKRRQAWRPAPLLLALAASAFAQAPYNEKPTYGRSRDFDLQHLKLELSFDLDARKIMGTATLRMAPLAGDVRELTLDSAALNIESVTAGDRKLEFHTAGEQLIVTLDKQYPPGAPVDFVIHYNAQPKRGLFFVFPDKFHPDRPKQIWANGDTAGGNNRYWFPCFDFPNDKTTTEMLVTVPPGWQVLSNGKLAGAEKNVFHWVQDKPMSTYLISLVAGEFEKGQDRWTVPVEYYVPKGHAADIPRTFGRTVDMLEFFSKNVAPYPWAKYDQSMVDTFGGGMENTSATTEGASAILDPRDGDERKAGTDSLIAHEMAHQWFGDLVTCADWRHTWLNEGFATYFEALWEEHAHGRDLFDWKEFQAARGMTSGNPGTASVVPKTDAETAGAYGLIYNKGGWTLHMLRGQLGDARFWKAIQFYTKKYSYQNATTSDFVEAVSEATGRDMEWLFDQYVYRPGYPEFDFTWDYDGEKRMLHGTLKQNKASLFKVPLEIAAFGDHGSQTFTVTANGESQDFYFALNERPVAVLLDPRDIILKRVTYHQDAAQWIWLLKHASSALNRVEAAWRLAAFSTDAVAEALGSGDAFYGVRVEEAQSLGRIHTDAARAALMKMLSDPQAEVRGGAAGALGGMTKTQELVDKLLEIARTDSNFNVRRVAMSGAMRLKPEHALDLLKPFLTMDSPHAEMQAGAVSAIQLLGDENGVGTLLEFSQSHEDRVRQAALYAFAVVGKKNQAVTDRLMEALEYEPDRTAAIQVLRARGETAALPILDRIAASDALPGVVRQAQSAAEAIRGKK